MRIPAPDPSLSAGDRLIRSPGLRLWEVEKWRPGGTLPVRSLASLHLSELARDVMPSA